MKKYLSIVLVLTVLTNLVISSSPAQAMVSIPSRERLQCLRDNNCPQPTKEDLELQAKKLSELHNIVLIMILFFAGAWIGIDLARLVLINLKK
jgi:hypothetical protein